MLYKNYAQKIIFDSEKTDEGSVLLIQPFNLNIYFYNFKLKNTFLYLIFSDHLSNKMWI